MIKLIGVDSSSVFLVPENQKTWGHLKKILDDFKKVRTSLIDIADFKKKISSKIIVLYDPKGLYGGVGKNE
jgi:hypothetical protein